MRWLRPKRPLRPERKQRKTVAVQSLVGQDVNIVVNVVRAFEVGCLGKFSIISSVSTLFLYLFVNIFLEEGK